MEWALFGIGVLFVIIVAPLWIIFHYVTRWKTGKALSAEDERLMAELWDSARAMENRIGTLEQILDAEAPGWRTRT